MKITTFKNGVRAVVIPLKGMRAVTVEVQVKIGAKYESKSEAGLSHFLEHMAFKGTEKRPRAVDIFREMDSRGADFNAETGLETTGYSVTTTTENREWALEILSDILFNSQYPDEEIKKERGVIMEEIKMYRDNPMMGLGSEVVKWLWGGSPIGCWNISGELEDIDKVSRDDLAGYHQKFFDTREMVVTAAGNVSADDMKLLEKYFGVRTVSGRKLPEVAVTWTGDTKKVINRSVEQGHLGVMVPTFGSMDSRRYALKLLNGLLAGNASSRLFEEIRSKRGWAYYVYPIGEEIKEAGFWGVQAGVPENKLNEALELTEKEIIKVADDLKPEEVERTKAYRRGKIELLMDKSDFWSGFVASRVLLEGEVVSPEEELQKVDNVTMNEVKDLASGIFKREKIKSLVIVKKK